MPASHRPCGQDDDGALRRGADSGHRVLAQGGDRVERVADAVPGDHLAGHLPHAPRRVVRGVDDRLRSAVVPGVQQASDGPDPRPVAALAAVRAVEDVRAVLAAERRYEVVVDVGLAAVQEFDAAGYEGVLAAARAFGGDPLLRGHAVFIAGLRQVRK